MTITWRIPDCAHCREPIEGEKAEFEAVQHFGDEGDYYFHAGCYEEWRREIGDIPGAVAS